MPLLELKMPLAKVKNACLEFLRMTKIENDSFPLKFLKIENDVLNFCF